MINFDFDTIGTFSKIRGAVSTSVSKWEKSFFGGFYQIVVDYPQVKIDDNIELSPAASPMGYFEKEKVLKIFLSQAKELDALDLLVRCAKTKKTINPLTGETVIKTTIGNKGKIDALDVLTQSDDYEYAPLFDHYRKFILDSEISFSKTLPGTGNSGNSNGKNENCENGDEKNNDKNKNKKSNDNDSDGSGDKKKNKNNKGDKNKSGNKKDSSSGDNKKSKSKTKINKLELVERELERNSENMMNALKNTVEKKIKFLSLTAGDNQMNTCIEQPGAKTRYSQKQKDTADRLTNMLDISFDPAEDTVKNLRLGKLDVAKIAEVPAGNIAVYKQTVENQTTKPFSVAILCDESGSMDECFGFDGRTSKLTAQHGIVKSLYRCFSNILPQEKIFIYGHGDGESVFVYQDKYNQNFENTIDNMIDHNLGGNYDGPAIELVYKQIRNFTNDRIIFIVLSDGAPNGSLKNMKKVIEKCKRDEFVTIGIGIQAFHVKDLYQYSAVIEDLDEMPKKISHIVNHVVKTEFK